MSYKEKVHRAFREAGFNDLELWYDRSHKIWIFVGEDTSDWYSSVAEEVWKLRDQTPQQWVEQAVMQSQYRSGDCGLRLSQG